MAAPEAFALKDTSDSLQNPRYISSIFMWMAFVFSISKFWYNGYRERSTPIDNKGLGHRKKKCH